MRDIGRWFIGGLIGGGLALAAAGAALGQEVVVSAEADRSARAQSLLRSNASVVVPQSRGFRLDGRGDVVLVERVRAHVRLLEETARTTLDISLRNPGGAVAESVLLLPVPAGAVVSHLDFEGSAAEPTAMVLEAREARRLYDDIVRRARDPALLEFAGHTLVRSSVFPVPANGTQRVRIVYEHVVPSDGGRVDYVLPRSEALDVTTPWEITAEVKSADRLATVYSPSHAIETTRRSDHALSLKTTEAARTEPGAFRLSYLLERGDVAGTLFAYPDPKIGGGYFLFLGGLPAHVEETKRRINRQVTIALDRSGSMAGGKLDQAKAAALQVIEGLADGERFNVVDYGTTVSSFAAKPVTKSPATTAAFRRYLDSIRPSGGTNLHDALVESLRQPAPEDALPLVLFLTDGLPTVGQRSEATIRRLVEPKSGSALPRIFTFGVGNDVNAPLLDRLSDATRAVSTYVAPSEDVEVAVAGVFRRLYGPVLSDIDFRAAEVLSSELPRVHDLANDSLPDVYEGDQLVVLGRYRGDEPLTVRLAGKYLGKPRAFEFTFDLAKATTRNAFVPRLWAARRIAYLADEIRQAGADPVTAAADPRLHELTDEIVALATEFGILSEYTAFLATEGTDLGDWGGLVAACSNELDKRGVQTRSGEAAVAWGRNFNYQKQQVVGNARNEFVDENLERSTTANVQQVSDRAFFKRGTRWVDASLVSNKTQLEPDRVVSYGSDEHLRILRALIEEGRQALLALRGDIVFRFEGKNVLIQNPDDC